MGFDNSFSVDLEWVREEGNFGKGTGRKGDD